MLVFMKSLIMLIKVEDGARLDLLSDEWSTTSMASQGDKIIVSVYNHNSFTCT